MKFFADHERSIYSPEGSDKKFDPLALDRALTVTSGGKLSILLNEWQCFNDDKGDVSPEGKAERQVAAAGAEEELAKIARQAFGLPDFPESSDAQALEYLCDFLEWMEGKGERGKSPQPSTESTQGASDPSSGTKTS